MIRTVKQTALSTIRGAGVFGLASRSQWRTDRLLILGYHGIAQDDENQWSPALFMTPALLERRLRFLNDAGFRILPFEESLTLLRAGRLPARSVTITFDDGYVDFYRLAYPLLRAYKAPATVYLTTYYSDHNLPIPGITAAYMIWKSRSFIGPIKSIPGFGSTLLHDPEQRRAVSNAVGQYFADERSISREAKHELLANLAAELGFDLEDYRARRIMHLMTAEEASELAADGLDIQLHTHRHWVPQDEGMIRREITENRTRIEAITNRPANHFCYPSGVHYPALLPWLRALNVRSATTCGSNLASSRQEPLLLPRFLDHSGVSQVEFEAWATGVGSVLPRRNSLELVKG